MGFNFSHMIPQSGMILDQNFKEIVLVWFDLAGLTDENSWKVTYMILYDFFLPWKRQLFTGWNLAIGWVKEVLR